MDINVEEDSYCKIYCDMCKTYYDENSKLPLCELCKKVEEIYDVDMQETCPKCSTRVLVDGKLVCNQDHDEYSSVYNIY